MSGWRDGGGGVGGEEVSEGAAGKRDGRGKRMQVNHADPFRGCKDTWYTKNVMVFLIVARAYSKRINA